MSESPRSCCTRRAWALGCVMLLGAAGTNAAAQADTPSVERIRAAFTLNFARYTTWPATRNQDAFRLCVAAGESQLAAFSRLEGQPLHGRTVRVSPLLRPEDAPGCDLLYVGAGSAVPPATLLQAIGKQPTLTVGDGPAFLDLGGTIRLFVSDPSMRFEISQPSAARAGLSLSPQLLRLAHGATGARP